MSAIKKMLIVIININFHITGAVTLSEEAVESLSPSAAATSKLLKSGMSLTQVNVF